MNPFEQSNEAAPPKYPEILPRHPKLVGRMTPTERMKRILLDGFSEDECSKIYEGDFEPALQKFKDLPGVERDLQLAPRIKIVEEAISSISYRVDAPDYSPPAMRLRKDQEALYEFRDAMSDLYMGEEGSKEFQKEMKEFHEEKAEARKKRDQKGRN